MWGESSKNCERNCQCSGLITDSFKINSGSGTSKRKQEEASAINFKFKMNPHTLDFKSPLSPLHTPSKRRVLGEIQNSPSFQKSPLIANSPFLPKHSPVIERLRSSPMERMSPLLEKSSPTIERLRNSPLDRKSPLTHNALSPLTSRLTVKRSSTKISRIFEERSRFKSSNKENDASFISETFVKLDMEEETRDCTFGDGFRTTRETRVSDWSMTKLDFTDALQTKSYESEKTKTETVTDLYVPEKDMETDLDPEFETLHDLEEEFENDNFDQCTKYEIISTDSPNIISRGRSSTSRKVNSRNFVFGAPLADSEPSTSFNKPNVNATRMLTFDEEGFEFTSPAVKRPTSSFSVKKSLKFNETPTKNPLRNDRSDSSIGSMTSSPSSSQVRLFTSESTASMESGFISELEEPFLDFEEVSNSPKMANFNELLCGQIKENVFTSKDYFKRPPFQRSLSFNPDSRAKVSLFAIKESPDSLKKCQKRTELSDFENVANKKRKSNCASPEIAGKVQRPVLQRAMSENHASIMSALARSAAEPDLIGDFSLPYALPLAGSDHSDLKAISCDTLACLLRGEYADSVSEFKIVDCRYPYEFEGGHIPGAVNLHTPSQVQGLLNRPLPVREADAKRSILIFHCEFSIERGPKLYRYLRSSDRTMNAENYPNLNYPEIYLLHQGYRTFFEQYPELCSPIGYTTMMDPKHTLLLKKHRSIEEPASFFTHHRSKSGHRLMY